MKLLIFAIFGLLNINDINDIKSYVNNSSQMEFVLAQFSYKQDTSDADEWKTPQQFIHDKGGDCEDFATIVYEILKTKGYDTVIYSLYADSKAHAICYYSKGKDTGYFTNNNRIRLNKFNISKLLKNLEYDRYEIKRKSVI